jgi:hypothetical protein
MSRLDLQLIARRIGWVPCIAAALVIASVAVATLCTAKLAKAIDERSREFAQLRANGSNPNAVVVAEKPLIEQRLEAFTALLGDKRDLNNSVAAVFAQSSKHGLTLAEAEYKLEYDKLGGFYLYKMTLPVRGPYLALRRFVDGTLQSVPFAALDEVVFRRDGIGVPQTEAKLRFVFYLKDAAP